MRSVIAGAGGHGRVVLDILLRSAAHQVAGFVDSDPSLTGSRMDGKPVLGTLDDLPRLRDELGVDAAIVAIGDNGIRREFADKISSMGFVLINAIHPSANLAQSVSLGSNIVIAAGALVCAHCHIGDSVILNTGCIVDHESMIAPGSHVCPGARIAGRVNIQAGVFIGIGATVIQSVQIGHHAIVGAGAVVIDDVASQSTVVGVPARIKPSSVSAASQQRDVVTEQLSAQNVVAPLLQATGHRNKFAQ
ncbi:MAG: transferase [Phycisphaerae bacterium]|nr:MAG: transferase [Phycisphaerae bacterium]